MGYAVLFIALILGLQAPVAGAQERLYRGDPDSPLARSKKINPNLRVMAQELGRRGITDSNARASRASSLSGGFARVDDSAALQAYLHLDSVETEKLAALQSRGVRIEISNAKLGIVQGWIPYQRMDSVAELPFVRRITVPSFGTARLAPCVDEPSGCRTEGDSIHRADELRDLGFDGGGVRVGVISDGIDGLCDAVAAGELPSGIQAFGTCNDANPCLCSNGAEGTAMLEIVHDMAPGAALGFGSGIASSLQFIQSVEELTRDFQADIIVDDIGFFLEPYFEDGPIAQAVQAAIDQGVLYVSSAGNQAQEHYEGDYVDSGDGRGSHQISGGNNVFNISGFFNVLVILQWSNPFGQADDDYDICFADETPEVCATYNERQDGDDDPLEFMAVNCLFDGCELQVRRVSGQAQRLELFILDGGLEPGDRVLEGSIFGHPAVPGVFAAAAVDVLDPGNDTVEAYSSRGPSRIEFPALEIRDKPDIAASDGVEVSGFGGFPSPFFGTSAAAPHVAAVLAQLLGGLGPAADIPQAVKDGAVDIEAGGFDSLAGFGRLDALAAAGFLQKTPDSFIDSPVGDLEIELGEMVEFRGSCTTFDGLANPTFHWSFGENSGIPDSGAEDPGSLGFAEAGEFEVAFTCTDGSGIADNTPAIRLIRVQGLPTPTPPPSPSPSPSPSAIASPPPVVPPSPSSGGCSLMIESRK